MEAMVELVIVAETIAAMGAASELDDALAALLQGMRRLTGAAAGGVRLLPDPARPLGPCRLYFWNTQRGYEWVDAENLAGSNTVHVLETGAGVYSANLTPPTTIGDFAASAQLQTPRPGSSIIVPLRLGARSIGTLHADSPRTDAFRPEMVVPLQVLADYAGGTVRQAQLHAEALARLRRLEAAQRVAAAVNSVGTLDTLLTSVLHEALAVSAADHGQIALVDADRRFVRGRVAIGLPQDLVQATVRQLYPAPHPDEDVYAIVVRTGEQLRFDDHHPAVHRATQERFALFSQDRVLTPINYDNQTIGVLGCVWRDDAQASEDDLAMLRLVAQQAGGAIARTRLAEAESAARQRLTTALQASATIVYTYDLDGRLRHIEGPTEPLLGWVAAEMIGHPAQDFIAPIDVPGFAERVNARRAGDQRIFRQEARLHRRDGAIVTFLATSAPHIVDGAVVGTVGALTDLTAIRQLQSERDAALAARARAEGAIRTGRSVAHELASPLGAALGISELLALDPRLPSDVILDLQLLQQQVTRVGHLLHRFGRIARYEESPSPGGPRLDLGRAAADGGA